MKNKNFIPIKYLDKRISNKLNLDFEIILKKINKKIEDAQSIFNLFSKNYKFNFNIKDLKRFEKYNSILIIGMGGSILGAEAIFQFLKKKIDKNIYFLDDLDEENINKLKKQLMFKKTLFVVISKSGNTIETLSNLFHLKILKNKAKNIIVISEKKNNVLYNLSKQYKLFYIEHKKHIGGRYSVLSEVGIVPAYLMGLDVINFRKKIREFLKSENKTLLKENTVKLANLIIRKKYSNQILLNYAPQLDKFLYWKQQLIAESLGKNGKGFLPVVSKAPKDHHSLLQLYLDGPKNKFFTIFSFDQTKNTKIKVSKRNKEISFINNRSLNEVKNSQKNALILALKKNKIPYREFIIKNSSENSLGSLFSYFMMETIILGKLAKINPFSQPAVEQVKKLTKKLLS